MSGTSPALEATELSFHQDLNGDGVIGVPGTIESFGATSLVQAGNHYFLDSNSTGIGHEVMFGGAPLTAGEFAWTPIAAEKTSTGYEIALTYAAVSTRCGTPTPMAMLPTTRSATYRARPAALESLETSFHQDLNGDGVIGVLIGSSASTNLVQVGSNYFLDSKSTGIGPEVMFGGAPLAAGEFAWTPIGAEQTSSGYEIALKYAGQYTVWNTDANGNVTYDSLGNVSGNSPALEATELSFHQDLNAMA